MEKPEKSATLYDAEIERRLRKVWPRWQNVLQSERRFPGQKTVIQYEKACQRMRATDSTPQIIGRSNRKSFNFYRAALIFDALIRLDRLHQELHEYDGSLSSERLKKILDEVEKYIALLDTYPPHSRDLPSIWEKPKGGASRKSKKVGLVDYPADWRARFCNEAAFGTAFHAALLVSGLIGARPSEIRAGIEVSVTEHWTLAFRVSGSKLTENSGQEWRRIEIEINNSIAHDLANIVIRDSMPMNQITVYIDSERHFSDDVRFLSKKIFPDKKKNISPYSFRHQAASDLKAQGLSVETIALFFGHQSGRSSRAYGCSRQGGKGPRIIVVSVEASTQVRNLDRLPSLKQSTDLAPPKKPPSQKS